jgi:hypothetical protein
VVSLLALECGARSTLGLDESSDAGHSADAECYVDGDCSADAESGVDAECYADTGCSADASPIVDAAPFPDVGPVEDAGPHILLDCPTALNDSRLPPLAPGHPGQIDGYALTRVPVSSFRWSVVNQGCDAMLPEPRYALSGANSPVVTFAPACPGAYELNLEIQTADGQRESCAFQVWAAGQGLRVELCWDTNTSVDLDLYLHRPDTDNAWFAPGSTNVLDGFDASTCNTSNCAARLRFNQSRVDWGYPDSPLERCKTGLDWTGFLSLGRCPNPRAADDNNQTIATGTAELVQLDNPLDGQTFRIMVQNFENGPAEPHVYVYCGGVLQHHLPPPLWPPDFWLSGASGFGVMWRPADVRMHVDADGITTGCTVEELRSPNSDTDYVTINDPSY